MSGYLTYVKFTAGTAKGGVAAGDTLNDPWTLGIEEPGRANYTGASVVDSHKATAAEVLAHKFSFVPFGGSTPEKVMIGTTEYEVDDTAVDDTAVKWDATANEISFGTTDTKFVADAVVKVLYTYDNVSIPQDKLPVYNAKMESIALVAKARRIAIRYSQMAAFQAKNDYGFDMQQQLAAQAVGELAYEIDTEVVAGLNDAAGEAAPDLKWNILRPQYISKSDHYEGFAEVIEAAKAIMFNRTRKFAPNYMVANSKVLRVLPFIKGWSAASVATMNGPYLAGTLNGIRVFISPALADGRFFLGVNQGDVYTSAAVYAPYMAICPTQLLGFADGSMTQGFSTLYDFKILNKELLVAGEITSNTSYTEGSTSAEWKLG